MIIAINKPKGPTSYNIISQIKKLTGIKKVGHAGTLDPLASGVLVVAIGRDSTKKISLEVQKEKEYKAVVKLGETSTTDDEEGEKTKVSEKIPTQEDINNVVKTFIGKISQTPPIYSALKINGQPSYKLARTGKEVEMKPRIVEIKEIEVLSFKYPYINLRVITGPGVYIRSLSKDIGVKLGTGAYMSDLERTRVGEFTLEKCTPLEDLEQLKNNLQTPIIN